MTSFVAHRVKWCRLPGCGTGSGRPLLVLNRNLVVLNLNPVVISLKLDRWCGQPNSRLKDKADVVELIKALKLPRDLNVEIAVRTVYQETWDGLQSEQR